VLLSARGAYEVVNASLFGMTLRSMVPFWRGWASQFRPQVVVIYPSPLFYLQDAILSRRGPSAERAPRPAAAAPAPSRRLELQSRFVDRVRDIIDVPDFIQRRRDERQIDALTASRPPGWLFTSAPEDRVELFADDLSEVIEAVQRSGATVVLATHAFRCSTPPTPEDLDMLNRSRVHSPRATPVAIHEFHHAINAAITRVGTAHRAPVVDADRALSGQPRYFGDLIHFTETGSAVMAQLLAERVLLGVDPRAQTPGTPAAVVAASPSAPQ